MTLSYILERPNLKTEPPTKRPRLNPKTESALIERLFDELFVKIIDSLTPKDLYLGFALVNKKFYRISSEFNKPYYRDWWERHITAEFPEKPKSVAYNLSSYQQEVLAKKNMLKGLYSESSLNDSYPSLNSISCSNSHLLIHTRNSISLYDLIHKKHLPKIENIFSAYIVDQNTIFCFSGNNEVFCYTLNKEGCTFSQKLKSVAIENQDYCVKKAKIFGSFLVGFAQKIFYIWNLQASSSPPISLRLDVDSVFVAVYKENFVYLKNNTLFFHPLYEGKEFFFKPPAGLCCNVSNVHFFWDTLVICWIKHNTTSVTIEINNLNTNQQQLISLNLKSSPSDSFIYVDTLYCWHQTQGVLAAICLKTFVIKEVPALTKKIWSNKKESKNPQVPEGSTYKLINGFIFTRETILDLVKNTLIDIGNTLCSHNHFALDYSKVTYFNGILVRGYSCTGDGPNIFLLDFNEIKKDPL